MFILTFDQFSFGFARRVVIIRVVSCVVFIWVRGEWRGKYFAKSKSFLFTKIILFLVKYLEFSRSFRSTKIKQFYWTKYFSCCVKHWLVVCFCYMMVLRHHPANMSFIEAVEIFGWQPKTCTFINILLRLIDFTLEMRDALSYAEKTLTHEVAYRTERMRF